MTRFWTLTSLDSPKGYGRPVEWYEGEMDLEGIACSKYVGHKRAGHRVGKLSIILRGNKVGEFLWTWLSECIIQDRVLEMFREQNFTGFETRPVNVTVEKGINVDIPVLHELVVTGWAGDATEDSGVRLVNYCPHCLHANFSAPTNPSSLVADTNWDGSDFFIVWPLPKFIFVSSRVAEFIEERNLKGCELIPVEKLNFDCDQLSPGTPPQNKHHQRFQYDTDGSILNLSVLQTEMKKRGPVLNIL